MLERNLVARRLDEEELAGGTRADQRLDALLLGNKLRRQRLHMAHIVVDMEPRQSGDADRGDSREQRQTQPSMPRRFPCAEETAGDGEDALAMTGRLGAVEGRQP